MIQSGICWSHFFIFHTRAYNHQFLLMKLLYLSIEPMYISALPDPEIELMSFKKPDKFYSQFYSLCYVIDTCKKNREHIICNTGLKKTKIKKTKIKKISFYNIKRNMSQILRKKLRYTFSCLQYCELYY